MWGEAGAPSSEAPCGMPTGAQRRASTAGVRPSASAALTSIEPRPQAKQVPPTVSSSGRVRRGVGAGTSTGPRFASSWALIASPRARLTRPSTCLVRCANGPAVIAGRGTGSVPAASANSSVEPLRPREGPTSRPTRTSRPLT